MEIRYPDATYPLEVPEPSELRAWVESLRRELALIGSALAAPPPLAKPAVETCRHSPVRQLCPDYWDAASTRPLRGLPIDTAASMTAAPPFRDIRVTSFPAHCGGRKGVPRHGKTGRRRTRRGNDPCRPVPRGGLRAAGRWNSTQCTTHQRRRWLESKVDLGFGGVLGRRKVGLSLAPRASVSPVGQRPFGGGDRKCPTANGVSVARSTSRFPS
jgi:hypothetical protein